MSLPKRIPWTLVLFLVGLFIPVLGSRYYTFLATDILIFAMFATSLNLLLGVSGLVPFGHAAYFGIGAYVCAIFMKDLSVPFLAAWLAGGLQLERRHRGRAGLPQRADAEHGVARMDPLGRGPEDRPQVLLSDADPGRAVDGCHAPYRELPVRAHPDDGA